MPPSEKAVRKQEIDRALQTAGWRVVSYARWSEGDRTAADAIEEYPTDRGPGDYLSMLDGRPVADVEAKKHEVSPENVVEQAKRYSRALQDSPFHLRRSPNNTASSSRSKRCLRRRTPLRQRRTSHGSGRRRLIRPSLRGRFGGNCNLHHPQFNFGRLLRHRHDYSTFLRGRHQPGKSSRHRL